MQTLLLLLSLLLLLPLFFLLSFLIVVLLLELLSTDTVVNQFDHLRLFFFSHPFSLLSSRLSRCFSTRESANPVAAQLRYRWRATLPCLKATLRSSSRRVFSHRNASASNKCKPCCSAVVASLLQMLLLNLHVRFVVIVLLFKFLHNADESLKDMDPLASRPANCRTRDQDDAGMGRPICM